jgi:Tfp pilus assembly protein PilV
MTRTRRSGFTLVEVVVATVVLELGILAALSLVTLAIRATQRAVRTEHLITVLADVADSLAMLDSVPPGRVLRQGVEVRWTGEGAGTVLESSWFGADTVRLVVAPAGAVDGL